jgi:hypothetical protein
MLDPPGPHGGYESIPFESLVATLPDGQREVITMLKAAGMTVEKVAPPRVGREESAE